MCESAHVSLCECVIQSVKACACVCLCVCPRVRVCERWCLRDSQRVSALSLGIVCDAQRELHKFFIISVLCWKGTHPSGMAGEVLQCERDCFQARVQQVIGLKYVSYCHGNA